MTAGEFDALTVGAKFVYAGLRTWVVTSTGEECGKARYRERAIRATLDRKEFKDHAGILFGVGERELMETVQ